MRDALTIAVPRGDWPKDRRVRTAEQPAAIGHVLCAHTHKALANVSIGYLFVESMGKGGKDILTKSSACSGPLEFYSKHTFLVRVNWSIWLTMTAEQRVATIDEALCAFCVEDTAKGTRYQVLPPDFEGYGAILTRWGLWRADLRKAASLMAQRDLFEKPSAGDVSLSSPDSDDPDPTD